nr:MAG: ATPase 3 [Diabrotica toursvirus 3a]
MEDNYIINQFDPDLIAPTKQNYKNKNQGGSKIVFIGKPGTGKSTLIKYILYSKLDVIPIGVVINGTEMSTGCYSEIFPPLFVYNEYKESIIKEFINRQIKAKEELPENPWGLLLLDDCTDDRGMFKSAIQNNIFKNGRHYKMLYCISLQYSIDLPPALRTCVDGCFIFKENNDKNLKNLYENYAGIFPTFQIFKKYMVDITGNYTALYIDSQNQNTKEWYECVYYVKAPILPDFKFGCNEYRAYGRDRLNKKYRMNL